MTPEQLEILVLEADNTKVLQTAFSSLTEKERKALSNTAQKLRKQISRNSPDKDASEQLRKYFKQRKGYHWGSPAFHNADMALFALCPPSVLKRRDLFINWADIRVVEQILVDRKPDWLDQWLAWNLENEFHTLRFSTVRRWIREGICNKPEVDGYYQLFAQDMKTVVDHRDESPRRPLSEQLLNEPDMLEDVWRLFEIENNAFDGDSWYTTNAPEHYETWSDALVKLSQADHIDRTRLLDATLSGLFLELKQTQLSGMHNLHTRLSPTKNERLERQPTYRSLLCHKVGHVVKFALSMLGKLERDKALDGAAFLAEVQAVFFQETKGNAITALKLIKRIVKRNPTFTHTAIGVAAEALRHSNLDVQALALELIEEHEDSIEDGLRIELDQISEYVAESIKSKLLKITQHTDSDSVTTGTEETADTASPVSRDNLLSETRKQTAVDGREEAESWFEYQPIAPNILQYDILPSVTPVAPVADIDELIAALSHAVETVDSPDEVERIVDGISRLCADRANDFDTRVAPLLHRLQVGGGLANQAGIAGGLGGFRLALADLILTWLTGKQYQSKYYKYFAVTDALEPAIRRLRDIMARVVKREPLALVGAPTHSGGWIDPVIWIERIIAGEKQKITFDRTDFCFSLLRLTPDNRDKALQQAHRLSDKIRPVVEFALGGEATPGYGDRSHYDLWISAARCRDPYRDWRGFFEPMRLHDAWADSLSPARVQWRAYRKEHRRVHRFSGKEEAHEWATSELDIEVSADADSKALQQPTGILGKLALALGPKLATDWKRLPSAALNHCAPPQKNYWQNDLQTTWVAHWLTYQWPLCPDGAYVKGVKQLISRIDMDSSTWDPGFGYFHGLFQKNRPWREAGHLLLCIGLIGKDADARAFAVDALIAGIENGCADHGILTDTLVRLTHGGWLKLNRLGDNLLQISQVSLLHAWFVSRIIQHWLPSVELKQHNMFRMLEVLLETQSVIKQPLLPESIKTLKDYAGASKAAKLAGKLLVFSDFDPALNEELTRINMACRPGSMLSN